MALITAESGPLSFGFDTDLGMVRYVRFGGTETVRGIYTAVRDIHWGTYARSIQDLDVQPGRITWKDHSGPMVWQGTITYNDRQLRFEVAGEAQSAFETQRTGVCFLHPAESAGVPCSVLHVDGSVTESHLPDLISPHQPFFSIAAIETQVDGITTRAEFEGEIFEMEDQRNWMDASFKAYCRPHNWPRPYPVAEGEQVTHAVTLSFAGNPTPRLVGPVEITRGIGELPLPRWESRTGITDPAQLGEEPVWFGADYNFTELNRSEVDVSKTVGLFFAVDAQVHAFDDRSIAETLIGLGDVIRSAEKLAEGRPLHVGPIRFGRPGDPRELRRPWSLAVAQILAEHGVPTAEFADPSGLEEFPLEGSVVPVRSSDPMRARAYARPEGTYLLGLDPDGVLVAFEGSEYALATNEIRFIPA